MSVPAAYQKRVLFSYIYERWNRGKKIKKIKKNFIGCISKYHIMQLFICKKKQQKQFKLWTFTN